MKRKSFLCLIVLLLGAFTIQDLIAEHNLYDHVSILPQSGFQGFVPEEDVDLFSGALSLKYLDVYLPGPNGFDLKIWRVYNSKIVKDRLPGEVWQVPQDGYSWVGLGWSLHMGRVFNYNSDKPVIEFPDGKMETAYQKSGASYFTTKSYLKYDKANRKLYFKDGTVWTFGAYLSVHTANDAVGVTSITNSFGHTINISYLSTKPIISQITDSLGRVVLFEVDSESTTHPKLERIQIKSSSGSWKSFYYTVGNFYGGYYQLEEVDPPLVSATTYGYNSEKELSSVNTSFGGRSEYSYGNHTFYYTTSHYTRVLTQKRTRFTSDPSWNYWDYSYPSYYSSSYRTVTVSGPEFTKKARFHMYSSTNQWKMGLLEDWWYNDDSYHEDYVWDGSKISDTDEIILSTVISIQYAPRVRSITKVRKGDADSVEEYQYGSYGLPSRIDFYSEGNRKYYKNLDYYYEINSTFASKYMLSHIQKEQIYSNSGSKLKETQTSYYTSTGKCGAIDSIKKWKSGSTYLTWNYTYSSTNPNFITIDINLPGNAAGTESYEYRYGVLSRIEKPGYSNPELNRSISQHNSLVLSETNQHGGTFSFSYDSLGRMTQITTPSAYNNITVGWSSDEVDISQSNNTVTRYWDGFLRDTGYNEYGDGIVLYHRKILDAEGRVEAESRGPTDWTNRYHYQFMDSGVVNRIEDPRGKVTTISHSGDITTITDPNGKTTEMEYKSFPGNVSTLTDALNNDASYSYDGLARLASLSYEGRSHSYSYDGMDNLLSESHPETGTISYSYNSENNLSQKSWGGTSTSYNFNSSNQLTNVNDGDETISYSYDTRGRVNGISSSKGWSKDLITYNYFGSILGERHNIPGLGYKSMTYTYSGNNNLASITYPNGKTISYSNNSLNMPESAGFNGVSLINATSYGDNEQPTYMNFNGNGTEFFATYNDAGLLSSSKLQKGSTIHLNNSYGYDGVGNITSISNTTPSNNMNFSYDSLYRLTSASYGVGSINNYGYSFDIYGNLTSARENGGTVFSKSYNSNNRITSYGYDNRGNMTSQGVYSYSWDNQNRLNNLKVGGITKGEYLYDENGMRLRARRPAIALPAITITAPNGGEKWIRATQQTITWTSNDVLGNVKIEYSTNNGSNYTTIIESTPNDGSHTWTTPDVIAGQCLIKISELDGDPVDTSDSVFYISDAGTPGIDISRSRFNFGSVISGPTTASQFLNISNSGTGTLFWNISNNANWLECTPSSGVNSGTVELSINPTGLSAGSYFTTISIQDAYASNSPQLISIVLGVYSGGGSQPFGYLDIPVEGPTYYGAFAVCGWALDDIEIDRVEVKREPYPNDPPGAIGPDGLVYIGDGCFVEGARPDLESYFPNTPFNYRGGWGYMLLSYGLPNQAMDNTYTIVAVAYDTEGKRSEIGRKTIYCNNANAVKPFGTIDTPEPGMIFPHPTFGNINFGWALTPQPKYIPFDGSTIFVYIDSVLKGNLAEYGNYSPSVAAAFPGYANTNNSYGHYFIDLNSYQNGLHSIQWTVYDSEGQADGIGSRQFFIQNPGGSPLAAHENQDDEAAQEIKNQEDLLTAAQFEAIVQDHSPIQVYFGFKDDNPKHDYFPDTSGYSNIDLDLGNRMVILLKPNSNSMETNKKTKFKGYSKVKDSLRHLPIGSTFDAENGIFYWWPLPAFYGDYEFVFIENDDSNHSKKKIKVRVGGKPKVDKDIISQDWAAPVGIHSPQSPEETDVISIPAGHGPWAGSLNQGMPGAGFLSTGPLSDPQQIRQIKKEDKVVFTASTLLNNYYIHSHDGKLLAEYNNTGTCVANYLYFGNRMIAEYRPVENEYYYYTSDQINSTRVVTNSSGNVVYSAVFSPYGKVHHEWVKNYDPKLKFSGKEREQEGELDYFGARYYGHTQYRFLSVDPVINKADAIENPQLWNLYAYCRNNPITYLDPDGRFVRSLTSLLFKEISLPGAWTDLYNKANKSGQRTSGETEVGGWIYSDGTLDVWDIRYDLKAEAEPSHSPSKELYGSAHTHPPNKLPTPSPDDKGFVSTYKTKEGSAPHRGKPIFTIHDRGVWVYDIMKPENQRIRQVMSGKGFRNFRKWWNSIKH